MPQKSNSINWKKIIYQAESSCMISRAIKGNVEIALEEKLSIG